MCGRFTLTVDPEVVQQQFDLSSIPASLPRYNITPTQAVLATINDGGRRGEFLRWGLIPAWAKDESIGSRMINARAETLAEKPAFRSAFKQRRCVIYADGFYEWKETGGKKRPLYIRLNGGQPFALAGLWEVWRPPESEEWMRTCTIVTTEPNAWMAQIHNRMPVILPRDALEFWLTPGEVSAAELMAVLRPWPDDGSLSAYPVSLAVNNPRNDTEICIAPVAR